MQQCDKQAWACFCLYSCYLNKIQLLSHLLINVKLISPSGIIRNVPFPRHSNNVLSHCNYSFPSHHSRWHGDKGPPDLFSKSFLQMCISQNSLCASSVTTGASQSSVLPLLKVKWSESHWIVSDSLWPHGLYSPWNSPGQILEWVAFPFPSGSSQPREQTEVSHIAGGFLTASGI